MRRWLSRTAQIAAVFALVIGALGISLIWYAFTPLSSTALALSFSISPGATLRQIAQQLVQAGVLAEPWRFQLLVRCLGDASRLQAGSYRLTGALSPYQLARQLTSGNVLQASLTIIEGWTVDRLRDAVDHHPHLQHLTAQLKDPVFREIVGIPSDDSEGLFFPDTYYFPANSNDLQLFRRAAQRMQAVLADAWAQRQADLFYQTPYQALILASIIEKETGQTQDRALVSAVFLNRLRRGMRLQSDPTVIYGLQGDYTGTLTKQQLSGDTPYNTYVHTGLPPTPIALPGLDSIQAALHPAQTSALFFVSRGDGSSEFSHTLKAHNRAVNRFIRKRPERQYNVSVQPSP